MSNYIYFIWKDDETIYKLIKFNKRSALLMSVGIAITGLYALYQRSKCKKLEVKILELKNTEGE